jgi:hypothetical protein
MSDEQMQMMEQQMTPDEQE